MPHPCLKGFPPKFHVHFLSPSLKLHIHTIIITYEIYVHHNNSDPVINMYTVSQKTARFVKKNGIGKK
jgi:hypothetical protein